MKAFINSIIFASLAACTVAPAQAGVWDYVKTIADKTILSDNPINLSYTASALFVASKILRDIYARLFDERIKFLNIIPTALEQSALYDVETSGIDNKPARILYATTLEEIELWTEQIFSSPTIRIMQKAYLVPFFSGLFFLAKAVL